MSDTPRLRGNAELGAYLNKLIQQSLKITESPIVTQRMIQDGIPIYLIIAAGAASYALEKSADDVMETDPRSEDP